MCHRSTLYELGIYTVLEPLFIMMGRRGPRGQAAAARIVPLLVHKVMAAATGPWQAASTSRIVPLMDRHLGPPLTSESRNVERVGFGVTGTWPTCWGWPLCFDRLL